MRRWLTPSEVSRYNCHNTKPHARKRTMKVHGGRMKKLIRHLSDMLSDDRPSTRQEELRSFIFLSVVMAPVVAVVVIAAYGFSVWIYQMFAGPPSV